MLMEITFGTWVAFALGVVPLVGWLLWWWNNLWYGLCVKARRYSASGTTKLLPGHMGLPFFGELFSFLWYFKVLRRPDDFINSKRHKYSDGVGMYKTHLFGSPAIISCTLSANKFVYQSDASFPRKWPTVELVGEHGLANVQGKAYIRIRTFVVRAINQPDPLRRVALMVQPRVITALCLWAEKGKINGYQEAKKVAFENIGKLFGSLEPGPALDKLEESVRSMLKGYRSYPLNFPGTTYHYALQCRKKVVSIFGEKLQKKKEKRRNEEEEKDITKDLMDGLMELKDDQGKQLNDAEVLDSIIAMVVGGHESSTLSMMWALYYLAKYPLVLQKLRDENIPLSKNKKGEFVTSDELAKLKYTNNVVDEIIRLSNIAFINFREAAKDVEYKGYIIPKGWKVILWLRYLHTNSENFEDPLCFNPDRWNELPKPEAYQIFGAGTKMCAGSMLARLQIAIFIHHLAIGYKWELINPDAKINYLPHTKPDDGVEISFSKL